MPPPIVVTTSNSNVEIDPTLKQAKNTKQRKRARKSPPAKNLLTQKK